MPRLKSRFLTAGSPSSTCRLPAISPCTPTPGALSSRSTARSIITVRSGPRSSARVRRLPGAARPTRRFCSRRSNIGVSCVRSRPASACSPSRCSTRRSAGFFSPATGWERSRSTTAASGTPSCSAPSPRRLRSIPPGRARSIARRSVSTCVTATCRRRTRSMPASASLTPAPTSRSISAREKPWSSAIGMRLITRAAEWRSLLPAVQEKPSSEPRHCSRLRSRTR